MAIRVCSAVSGVWSFLRLPPGGIVLAMSKKAMALSDSDSFNSYVELKQKLDEYGEQICTQFVKDDCKSVASANKNLSSNAKQYKQCFEYWYVRFQCKHGGSRRFEGSGIRRNQR